MTSLRILTLGSLLFVSACATSPTGRKQLLYLPDAQMSQMGATAFDQMKGETPVSSNAAVNRYVQCVAEPITKASNPLLPSPIERWEVVVFESPQVNAFALPGGKIGVYTGLLKVAKTPDQLAAVLGHETGHVIARHSNERASEQLLQQGALTAANAFLSSGGKGGGTNSIIMAALGLGTQVGIALPPSRTQESEADTIGEDLMAQAGFDPKASIDLWRNMAAAGGGQPPQILSTHPAHDTRIAALQEHLPKSDAIYQQARAAGRVPKCVQP